MSIMDSFRAWWRPPAEAPRAELTTSKQLEDVLIQGDALSAAGINVTPEVAMAVMSVSAAVSLISETAAQVPLHVYRRLPGGGKERAEDHYLWPLLHDQPNSWQDTFAWREMSFLHLLLWGNAYSFKLRSRAPGRGGAIRELIPLHPDRVRVEQDENYRVTYTVALPNGSTIKLAATEVFHLRDRTIDGFRGISRLKHGRESIGLARITERWGSQLFGNGTRPSGMLTTEQNLDETAIKQLRESWKAAHGGDNALGTAVLDGGLKWTPLSMNSDDAQFLETRRFQIGEIARLFRIPPHMLGDLERATFNNIEHLSLEFVKYSMMPWFRRFEAAAQVQLLRGSRDYFVAFVPDALLRGDVKSRFEAYSSALQNEWMTRNEVRERENLNPVPGGDEFKNPAINPDRPAPGGNPPPAGGGRASAGGPPVPVFHLKRDEKGNLNVPK